MANKPLKSIKFPGLNDTYTVPEVDDTLAVTGAAADAKKVGDEISDIKADLTHVFYSEINYPHKTVSQFFTGGTKAGYTVYPPSGANITLHTQEQYNAYWVIVNQSMNIFLGDISEFGYVAMGICKSSQPPVESTGVLTFTGTSAVRLRSTDNNIPNVNNKLAVESGDAIMIAFSTNILPSDVVIYYGEGTEVLDTELLNENLMLNNSQLSQIDEHISPELSRINGKVDKQQGTENAGKVLVVGSDGLVGLTDDLSELIPGLSDNAKTALLACFRHVAWIDEHGQVYYDALEAALNDIQSISAVYTQSGTVYATDTLDSLKENLVVTATKPDSTQYVVPDSKYTLSGVLMVGVSTITVTYKGQTATFNVNVTDSRLVYEIPANTDLYNYKRYDTQQHQFTVEEDFTILINTSYKANPRISYGNAFLLDGADGDTQSPGIRLGLDVVNSAENFITNYMYSDYYASQTYPINTERSVIWIVRNSNKQLRKVLYVDGSKIVDKSESLSSYTGKTYYDTYWIGGAHHLGSARPFDGIARLFRIYNTALDISEINAILGTELE